MNAPSLVRIRDLHFTYRRRPVFSGLNLDLEPGHIYGLLGRNGTGKSTLLRNIGGFLFPGKGSINAMGYEPAQRQPAYLEKVFLIPEEFNVPPVTVERWARLYGPFYPHFDRRQHNRYLLDFEIDPEAKMDEMSYGQQKKALISFALAANTPILLMDEPTNGLDIVSKSQFRKVIAGVQENDKLILISTHQVNDLQNLIDRVLVIDEGRILFNEDIDTIARTLRFKWSDDQEEMESAIYSESSLKGNFLVLPNHDGRESRPDLEMLYKAIVLNNQKLNTLFAK